MADQGITVSIVGVTAAAEHARAMLGDAVFEERVTVGVALLLPDAVGYARHEIQLARRQLQDSAGGTGRSSEICRGSERDRFR